MRIAFVSTYPPRRCGIATFTADMMAAVREADPKTQSRVAAIDERSSVRAYGSEVRWRIRQGSAMPYRAAAHAIDRSTADIVCVQNAFSLVDQRDAGVLARCAEAGVAYVPYFPLG